MRTLKTIDKAAIASERVTETGVHQFNKQGQKSVKTTTDPDNPQEVATMDDNKKQLLTDIFWETKEISSRTESKTEPQITESDNSGSSWRGAVLVMVRL